MTILSIVFPFDGIVDVAFSFTGKFCDVQGSASVSLNLCPGSDYGPRTIHHGSPITGSLVIAQAAQFLDWVNWFTVFATDLRFIRFFCRLSVATAIENKSLLDFRLSHS